jgi:hypothetical protein
MRQAEGRTPDDGGERRDLAASLAVMVPIGPHDRLENAQQVIGARGMRLKGGEHGVGDVATRDSVRRLPPDDVSVSSSSHCATPREV